MDPEAIMSEVVFALSQGHFEEVRALIRDLEYWTEKGGILPRVTGVAMKFSEKA